MDIHVVGCGPAGSLSAISLLKKGHNVTISEEHKAVGQPIRCSGLLSLRAIKEIERDFGVPIHKCVLRMFAKVKIISDNNEFTASLITNPLVLIDRSRFDKMCADKAVSLGAELHQEQISTYANLRSNAIIGADGPASIIANMFGFPMMKYIYTRQAYIDFGTYGNGNNELTVLLSNRFKGLFGWSIPHDDNVEIGLGINDRTNLDTAFQSLCARLDLKSDRNMEKVDWIIPVKQRNEIGKSIGGYNVFLVGDAAGQVKPLTGGGIYYASRGALTIANAIGDTIDSPIRYQTAWNSSYGKELRYMYYTRKVIDAVPFSLPSAVFGRFVSRFDTESITQTIKNIVFSIL